ncbi:MAG: helix-turn-helix domain-containing protein [Gammaproteobacteria bacterium]|nr:helix-turn-helix domain-containing protein [Gammaproteobacteria bacterium]
MYHYTGCGLRNIWLRNGFTVRDTAYGKALAIHDLEGLHRTIGLYLVDRKPDLSGAEVRFLRKELDMPQKRLAEFLGVSENSVRGWENDRGAISRPAEHMLRILYREHVAGDGSVRGFVERLAELDRRGHAKKLELEDTATGWRALAA